MFWVGLMIIFGVVIISLAQLEVKGLLNGLVVKGILGTICLVLVVYAISQVKVGIM